MMKRPLNLSENGQTENYGGKKSVKGNRQGVLSRSITRPQATKLQKNITKIYFAILKAACQKCLEDFLTS